MNSSLRIVGSSWGKAPEVASAPGGVKPGEYRGKVAVVTLGCAKNHVDSEVMLGVLAKSGFEIVGDVNEADAAIVNTCGFLESAATESIDCILELAELKKEGRLRQLIVAGCLVERHKEDLRSSLPEVDRFITTQDLMKIGDVVSGSDEDFLKDAARPYFLYDDTTPRFLATKSHTAYVKISEGCDRPCTFCIIPKIRGEMRSRSIESVVREVEDLRDQGVKEVNLVGQDLTAFGKDNGEGTGLRGLIEELDKRGAAEWIRLLYAYPIGSEDDLIRSVSELPRVCEYFDIPLQHSSDAVLKSMKRPLGRYSPRNLVPHIREIAPNVHIRTTFIVGFPGETDEDVTDLENFISEGHFSSVGVFTYSPERGTPSSEYEIQIAPELREERKGRLMLAQQDAVAKRLKAMVGETHQVLVDGHHEETELLFAGRTRFQAPDVDGIVIINEIEDGMKGVSSGHLGWVEITDTAGYDLVGKLVE